MSPALVLWGKFLKKRYLLWFCENTVLCSKLGSRMSRLPYPMVLLIALELLKAVQDCFGFFRSHDAPNGVCDAATKRLTRKMDATRSVYDDADVGEVACVEKKLKGAVEARTLVCVCTIE